MGLLNRPALTDRCVRRSSRSDSSLLYATTTHLSPDRAFASSARLLCILVFFVPVLALSLPSWSLDGLCLPPGICRVLDCAHVRHTQRFRQHDTAMSPEWSLCFGSERDTLYRASSCRPSRSRSSTPLNERALRRIYSLDQLVYS